MKKKECLNRIRKSINFWYLLPILLFAFISFIYFYPEVSDGKILKQGDTLQGLAIGHEGQEYKHETGEVTRWTGSLFSGMPTFQIAPSYSSNDFLKGVQKVYWLWMSSPVGLLFIMMLGFYILMISLNVRWYLAAFGAIAYAFSSYFCIIIAAGHIWKFITLAYIPPTIAGIIWTYRGKYLRGAAVVALFGALQIMSNHPQMSYYFLFVIAAVVIAFAIDHYHNHTMPAFFKATGVLAVAAILAVGANISTLYHTYKYSKETMRGGSELTLPNPATGEKSDNESPQGGLSKDYITQWSYGKDETLTLLIPNSKGGATGLLSENDKAMNAVDSQSQPYLQYFNQYWGDQPFTAGPVYVGALVVFLFVLGCFIVKGPLKWALLGVTIFTVMLSWGKNFMGLTDWFIDNFPMYDKFRTVSSILVVAEFCIPLLAVLALKEIFTDSSILKRKKQWFYLSGGIVAGIALLAAIAPGIFDDFISDMEASMYSDREYAPILSQIATARKAIFVADAWRTFAIVAIGFVALWCFGQKKINMGITVLVLSVVLIGDMYTVNKRYLNKDNFVEKTTTFFPTSEIDKYILQDEDMNYRVWNITGGVGESFNDPYTSYHHKSIGGYHAAKLVRYQDLINHQLMFENPAVINMLNTRYILQLDPTGRALDMNRFYNPDALGNAWFVNEIKWVDNADEEMIALNDFDPAYTAVIDRRFAKQVGENILPPVAGDTIYETGYEANKLTYRYHSQQGGLAVFSEIYFPWGWQITVDGEPIEMARANYVLRAVNLPAGDHEVIFHFDPQSIYTTEKVAYISLLLILGIFLAWGFKGWQRYKTIQSEAKKTE